MDKIDKLALSQGSFFEKPISASDLAYKNAMLATAEAYKPHAHSQKLGGVHDKGHKPVANSYHERSEESRQRQYYHVHICHAQGVSMEKVEAIVEVAIPFFSGCVLVLIFMWLG